MTWLWCLWFVILWWYLLDVIAFRERRRRQAKRAGVVYDASTLSGAVSLALPVFTAVLFCRQFFVDVYHIPSVSMEPTYTAGTRIVVNKTQYGIRIPFSGAAILLQESPERGDVVVFRYPREPRTTYVKRVIALPGDRVVVEGPKVFVNGTPVIAWSAAGAEHHSASLDGTTWMIQKPPLPIGTEPIDHLDLAIIVPRDRYFVLGDNLDYSQDSRHWGLLSENLLIGKVM